MPSPHAAAAARPPYVSTIFRGTTKVRLGVRASSPPTGIKYLLRQQVKGTGSLPQSDSLFPRTPNFTLLRGPFGIPSHLQRGICAGSSSPRRPKGQANQALRQGPPREHQSTQEVSTPIDVDGLTYSDENRSNRHLSLTPGSFVTGWKEREREREVGGATSDHGRGSRCAPCVPLPSWPRGGARRGPVPVLHVNVTYGTVSPLGVPRHVILINGQFPGPNINSTTNNNIVVNVFNNLDEPFLLTLFVVCAR
ncbi:hypothetical protein B296_00011608 [Ensete ventricosum]|uniref:Plastocyanin-like domain-containing protein n=1 Tax=Ensete ventricosum TaxID=4639 RepID=A0A427AR55_ENSVE|nr:hypothetical protein B296_00011608 [Ensete ventricosum]